VSLRRLNTIIWNPSLIFTRVLEFLLRTRRSLLFGFLTKLTIFATAVANLSKSAPAYGVPRKATPRMNERISP